MPPLFLLTVTRKNGSMQCNAMQCNAMRFKVLCCTTAIALQCSTVQRHPITRLALPEVQRNAMDAEFRDIFEMSCEKGC